MSFKPSAELMGEALDRVRKRWQREHAAHATVPPGSANVPRFSVAISREYGVPADEIARELGTRLSWSVYNRELLDEIAGKTGLRAELLESVDEHRSQWLAECLAAFGSAYESEKIGSQQYVHELVQVLLSLAAHGDCILVGRGATAVLPTKTTLRVRLIAPLKDRIARVAAEEDLDAAQAKRRIEEVERDRAAFVRQYFHQDLLDASGYDLVCNTSRFTSDTCAALIVAALAELKAAWAAEPTKGTGKAGE